MFEFLGMLIIAVIIFMFLKSIISYIKRMSGPEGVCDTLIRVYDGSIKNVYSHKKALELCLTTRYAVIKTLKSEDFPHILAECNSVGSLSLICFIAENPVHAQNADLICEKIYKHLSNISPFHAKMFLEDALYQSKFNV